MTSSKLCLMQDLLEVVYFCNILNCICDAKLWFFFAF